MRKSNNYILVSFLLIPLIISGILFVLIQTVKQTDTTKKQEQPTLTPVVNEEEYQLPEIYFWSGEAPLVVMLDVDDSLGMGWGYYLRSTIKNVIKGEQSDLQDQKITVAVHIFVFDRLLQVDGTLKTPLKMGFREDPDNSSMQGFRDSKGMHWELLSIIASPPVTSSLPLDPHQHVVDVNQGGFDVGINASDFHVVTATVPANFTQKENIVSNGNNTRRAFMACDQNNCQDELFIDDFLIGCTYHLQSAQFMPWRPFSDIVWVTDDIVVFDQWSQPHYGIHYMVDMRSKKLLLAAPFPDELQP